MHGVFYFFSQKGNIMNEIRLLIAGSRTFDDFEMLQRITDEALRMMKQKHPDSSINIISGSATGADSLATIYAKMNIIPYKEFPAKWNLYGKSAGPIRNKEMLDYILDGIPYLLTFWDGESRGTMNMINIAEKAGVPTTVVRYMERR